MLAGGGSFGDRMRGMTSNPLMMMGLSLLANPRNPGQSLLAGASIANQSQRSQMMAQRMQQEQAAREAERQANLDAMQAQQAALANSGLSPEQQGLIASGVANYGDFQEPGLTGEWANVAQSTNLSGPDLAAEMERRKMASSRAGAPVTNLSVSTGEKFGERGATLLAEKYVGEVEAGETANAAIGRVDTVLDLLNETDTGKLEQLKRVAGNYFGVPEPKMALIEQAAAAQLVDNLSTVTLGSVSEKELETMEKLAAGTSVPKEEAKAVWRSVRRKMREASKKGRRAHGLLSEKPEFQGLFTPYPEEINPYQYQPRNQYGEVANIPGPLNDPNPGLVQDYQAPPSPVQLSPEQQQAIDRARQEGLFE